MENDFYEANRVTNVHKLTILLQSPGEFTTNYIIEYIHTFRAIIQNLLTRSSPKPFN